ncbi:hypothetical protein GJ496_010736 [Pomphorhynchus laevis]|nr:hypothetical protein GJ496_010736 [Pomphorhynchus laevis]
MRFLGGKASVHAEEEIHDDQISGLKYSITLQNLLEYNDLLDMTVTTALTMETAQKILKVIYHTPRATQCFLLHLNRISNVPYIMKYRLTTIVRL